MTRGIWTSAGLCLILAGCAGAPIAAIRLPEPSLPACLSEGPHDAGVVGRYEFSPVFVAYIREFLAVDNGTEATLEALRCASATARALREAVTVIRVSNGEAK